MPQHTLKYYSVSLGCPKNRVDTEQTLGSLPNILLYPVESPEQADFVFINTCAFIQSAIEESVRTIVQIIADCSPKKPLIVVAGCLVGRFGASTMAADLPEVNLWLDNRDPETWIPKLCALLDIPVVITESFPFGRLLSTGPSYAWLKISDGCQHKCAFCTIPHIRGPLQSIPKKRVKAEASVLLSQGVKELILVAQDLIAWGQDIGEKYGLRTLLDELLPLSGLERLRLLYLYPAGITQEFLTYLKNAGAPFVPYFDIPLQHADPQILIQMGRPFARDPRHCINKIREVFPEAALRTTLIVGFPGETEAKFQTLSNFVEETRFQHLGVFTYQAEEGTTAAKMPNQVEETLKEARRSALMEMQAEISGEWLAGFVNERLSILVDAAHPDWQGLHIGRAWFQAPEIDGITYISGPGVKSGALIDAEIIESQEYDLTALA